MSTDHRLDKRLQTISPITLSQIAYIDELKGRWGAGLQLNPTILNRLKQSVLVTSTGASTRIEGAKLSDEDVERLMRGISIQKFIDRDKQEVRSYFELLQNVFDSWQNLTLSESTIKHFHQELLKHVEKDVVHRGEYKKIENKVHMVDQAGQSMGVLFDTTSPMLTPFAMHELVEWTQHSLQNKTHHPLLTIANFIVEFLQIHPFQDGNGRLSRILTNLLLLQAGYEFVPYVSHEKLIEDNKPDYYVALRTSQKTINTENEDIAPWITFFLQIVREQSQRAANILTSREVESLLSAKQLQVWLYLQSVPEAATSDIAKQTNIARPTVNQAINKLIKLERIERIGEGRATRYRVAR